MKLTDTRIGKDVQKLAREVEEAAQTSAAAPAPARPQVLGGHPDQDTFGAGGAPATDLASKATALKAKLDEVRGMLGPEAVKLLMETLPRAALAALKELQPDLPIQPGESAYLAFKQKTGQLLQLEMKVQSAAQQLGHALHAFAYGPQDSHEGAQLKDEGKILRLMQQGYTAAQAAGPNPDSMASYYANKMVATVRDLNQQLEKLWPGVPDAYQLKEPGGGGRGTLLITELFAMLHGNKYTKDRFPIPELQADLPSLRAVYPGYAALQKDVTVLKEHVRKQGMPSAEDVMVLKAEALSPQTPIAELYKNAVGVIGEIEGLTNGNRIKRETLAHASTTQGSSRTTGSASERRYEGGTPRGETHSDHSSTTRSSSSTQGTSQVLNLDAREYAVFITPDLERLDYDKIKSENHISPTEAGILMESLLTARRLYEAMLVREPDSPHTQALKGWMEESTFSFDTKEKHGYSMKDATYGALTVGNLRQDLLKLEKARLFPTDRLATVKDELALGMAKPRSGMRIKTLADI